MGKEINSILGAQTILIYEYTVCSVPSMSRFHDDVNSITMYAAQDSKMSRHIMHRVI